MVNGVDQIEEFLDEGANAIEADVTFDSDGTAKFMYHGFPCDCLRYCWYSSLLFRYLVEVRKLTTPGYPEYRENFVLLLLDCKLSSLRKEMKIKAGEDLAKKLIIYLWQRGKAESKVWILLSIPHTDHVDFIKSFRETLKVEGFSHLESKIGWDISGNEKPEVIENALRNIGINDSLWLSDGITNCMPRSISRLNSLIERRNLEKSEISKVYFWTIDREKNMKKALRLGVDGMITNKPKRLVGILNDPEFSNDFRLANITDNPWERIVDPIKHRTAAIRYGAESDDDYYFVECYQFSEDNIELIEKEI